MPLVRARGAKVRLSPQEVGAQAMRPWEAYTIWTLAVPKAARLRRESSTRALPSSCGRRCQKAKAPATAKVGISQFTSPSSSSCGSPNVVPESGAAYTRQRLSKMSASVQMTPAALARTS